MLNEHFPEATSCLSTTGKSAVPCSLSLSSGWMKLKVETNLFIQSFLTATDFSLSQAPPFPTFLSAVWSAVPASGHSQAHATF